MFDYIKGSLVHKNNLNNSNLTIDVNGVGYLIQVTTRDFAKVKSIGSQEKIYTILLHREDSMSICGFLQREDRDIFKILTSVSGVGSKMALVLLDEFESFELISLVINGNFKELSRAKGVGPKLAQKIILELKDKLINLQNNIPVQIPDNIEIDNKQAVSDAQAVLLSLGYEREEIKQAITSAVISVQNRENAEEILKEALKKLSV